MPEGSQADFESIRDSLTVIIVDGEECYGERPGGLPCPNTDQPVEFASVFNKYGVKINENVIVKPGIKSVDYTNYGMIGPDNPTTN